MEKDLNETKVYAYCDPRYLNNNKGYKYKFKEGKLKLKYKPFYIGCAGWGNHSRHLAGNKSSELVQKRIKKIRKERLDPVVKVLKVYKNKKKALKLEKILIIRIGRQDLGTGPLANQTDGGPGCVGMIQSEKSKRKIGENSKRYWSNSEYKENMRIKHSGENHFRTTFKERDVLRIRGLYKEKNISQHKLAEKFKVSRSCIQHIVNRHSWTHI